MPKHIDETEIVLQNFLREIEAAYNNSPRLRETFCAVNLSILNPSDVASNIFEVLVNCEIRKVLDETEYPPD